MINQEKYGYDLIKRQLEETYIQGYIDGLEIAISEAEVRLSVAKSKLNASKEQGK